MFRYTSLLERFTVEKDGWEVWLMHFPIWSVEDHSVNLEMYSGPQKKVLIYGVGCDHSFESWNRLKRRRYWNPRIYLFSRITRHRWPLWIILFRWRVMFSFPHMMEIWLKSLKDTAGVCIYHSSLLSSSLPSCTILLNKPSYITYPGLNFVHAQEEHTNHFI